MSAIPSYMQPTALSSRRQEKISNSNLSNNSNNNHHHHKPTPKSGHSSVRSSITPSTPSYMKETQSSNTHSSNHNPSSNGVGGGGGGSGLSIARFAAFDNTGTSTMNQAGSPASATTTKPLSGFANILTTNHAGTNSSSRSQSQSSSLPGGGGGVGGKKSNQHSHIIHNTTNTISSNTSALARNNNLLDFDSSMHSSTGGDNDSMLSTPNTSFSPQMTGRASAGSYDANNNKKPHNVWEPHIDQKLEGQLGAGGEHMCHRDLMGGAMSPGLNRGMSMRAGFSKARGAEEQKYSRHTAEREPLNPSLTPGGGYLSNPNAAGGGGQDGEGGRMTLMDEMMLPQPIASAALQNAQSAINDGQNLEMESSVVDLLEVPGLPGLFNYAGTRSGPLTMTDDGPRTGGSAGGTNGGKLSEEEKKKKRKGDAQAGQSNRVALRMSKAGVIRVKVNSHSNTGISPTTPDSGNLMDRLRSQTNNVLSKQQSPDLALAAGACGGGHHGEGGSRHNSRPTTPSLNKPCTMGGVNSATDRVPTSLEPSITPVTTSRRPHHPSHQWSSGAGTGRSSANNDEGDMTGSFAGAASPRVFRGSGGAGAGSAASIAQSFETSTPELINNNDTEEVYELEVTLKNKSAVGEIIFEVRDLPPIIADMLMSKHSPQKQQQNKASSTSASSTSASASASNGKNYTIFQSGEYFLSVDAYDPGATVMLRPLPQCDTQNSASPLTGHANSLLNPTASSCVYSSGSAASTSKQNGGTTQRTNSLLPGIMPTPKLCIGEQEALAAREQRLAFLSRCVWDVQYHPEDGGKVRLAPFLYPDYWLCFEDTNDTAASPRAPATNRGGGGSKSRQSSLGSGFGGPEVVGTLQLAARANVVAKEKAEAEICTKNKATTNSTTFKVMCLP